MKFILFFALLIWSHLSLAAVECGKVLSLTGVVDVHRNPDKTTHETETPPRTVFSAEANAPLRCDDIIETRERSSALMQLPRGKVAIGSKTKVAIAKYSNEEKPDPTLIDLFFGQLRALITKNKKAQPTSAPKFEVRTPTAVSGVRGTDFYIAYNSETKVTEQATLEGQVDITTPMNPTPVVVRAGQQVTVAEDKPVQAAPLSAALKAQIHTASALVEEDTEFVAPQSIENLGEPSVVKLKPKKKAKTETAGRDYSAPRWIFSIGPSVGEIKNSNGDYNGSSAEGDTVTVQRQKNRKGKSNVWALSFTEFDRDDNVSGNQIRSELSILGLEWGVRFRHNHWWSPFGRVGLGYLVSSAEYLGVKAERDYASFYGVVGVEALYKPFNWRRAAIFGSFDGQLNQTLFQIHESSNSVGNNSSINSLITSIRFGIAAEFK